MILTCIGWMYMEKGMWYCVLVVSIYHVNMFDGFRRILANESSWSVDYLERRVWTSLEYRSVVTTPHCIMWTVRWVRNLWIFVNDREICADIKNSFLRTTFEFCSLIGGCLVLLLLMSWNSWVFACNSLSTLAFERSFFLINYSFTY